MSLMRLHCGLLLLFMTADLECMADIEDEGLVAALTAADTLRGVRLFLWRLGEACNMANN